LGKGHDLLALSTVVFGAGGSLFENADDVVAGAPRERTEITFLARAGLVVGTDPMPNSAATTGNSEILTRRG
jgi:hypothetical protein